MVKVTIDEKEYDADMLSEEAKAQLVSLQFVDQKLAQLNAEVAAYQTARIGYANELKRLLEDAETQSKLN